MLLSTSWSLEISRSHSFFCVNLPATICVFFYFAPCYSQTGLLFLVHTI